MQAIIMRGRIPVPEGGQRPKHHLASRGIGNPTLRPDADPRAEILLLDWLWNWPACILGCISTSCIDLSGVAAATSQQHGMHPTTTMRMEALSHGQ